MTTSLKYEVMCNYKYIYIYIYTHVMQVYFNLRLMLSQYIQQYTMFKDRQQAKLQ